MIKKARKTASLILLNDDVNSFNEVMEALQDVIGMNQFQAEQCAILVHSKGECVIQKSDIRKINMLADVLVHDYGLNIMVDHSK